MHSAAAKRVVTMLGSVAVLALACQRPAPTTAPDATASAPADGASDVDGDASAPPSCRDWSTLKTDELQPLPHGRYMATFERAWEIVLTKHYDTTIACLDWPAKRLEYGRKIAAATNDAEAYGLMNAMLGELKHSHVGIAPPSVASAGAAASHPTGGGPAVVPVEVRLVGDALLVVDAQAYGFRSGIPVGAELVGVDDRKVAPLVAAMKKSWERDVEVALWVARAAGAWLTCPAGAKRTVAYTVAGSDKVKTRKVACKVPKLERASFGQMRDIPLVHEWRMQPGTAVGYVRFNIWMFQLLPRIEAAVVKLRKQGMKGLVIDLRGNPGGQGVMAVPVARLVMADSGSLGKMRTRVGEQEFNVQGSDDAFTGPVVVLVDEGTGSTSEIFAQGLRDLGRIDVFGSSPSQGAALPSYIESLPGGARMQFVVGDYQSSKGVSVEGKGVAPDTMIPQTQADYANERDPVLDAAVKALKAKAAG